MITRVSPDRIKLDGFNKDELRRQLTYIDKSVDFELNKARHSTWLIRKLGEDGWREHIEALKAKRKQCLLFEDEGGIWTYSGLDWWLGGKFNHALLDEVEYPEPKLIPWERIPDKKLRSYQESALEKLLEAKHGAVEIGTGLGKSFIILHLVKTLGLKTVVMVPSVSIGEQIYDDFVRHLGRKRVGKFFDGKKESDKLFVVGVDDSLSKIKEEDVHWGRLSQAKVFVADESHLLPARTLKAVCFGLLKDAPYRFFFSGTQLRNDGLDLLLDSITGKIVSSMTVKEGVDQGFLAKPMFRVVTVESKARYSNRDVNQMTRAHLYYNQDVCAKAAEIANLMVEELGRPTVILVKELEQFTHLLPYLRHEVSFAHGGVTSENKQSIPQKYWDSDPNALVKKFNEGKLSLLVGTSCITTGTDIQNVQAVIYLMGGKSEIQLRQAVGRGTRKPPGKEDCFFIDFDVSNIEDMHRHALERQNIYRGIYPDFEELSL